MKALCWHGKHDVRYDTVPDSKIEHPRDAIIKVTACAICGSDLHLYDGIMPTMKSGDTLGHETMGEVVEVGPETLDFMKEDIYDRLQEMTKGRGPDACIDAVGTEPETSASLDSRIDRLKVATFMGADRPHVLRQAIHCCRNFGVVSIVGMYGGFLDKIPMGSAINRGLTFRMAQTPVQHYLPNLLARIEKGEIDPSFVITHRAPLSQGPDLYKTFRDKQDGCIKVMMLP